MSTQRILKTEIMLGTKFKLSTVNTVFFVRDMHAVMVYKGQLEAPKGQLEAPKGH